MTQQKQWGLALFIFTIGCIVSAMAGWFVRNNSTDNTATYRSKSTYDSPSQCPTLEDKLKGMEILSIQWEARSQKCIYQYRVNVD